MHALKTKSGSDILGFDDYIKHQAARGIFKEDAIAPECDPRVLGAYNKLVRSSYPLDKEAGILLLAGKYGFHRDATDDERAGLNWAMSTPLIDICIGVAFDEFKKDLPALHEELGDDVIITDTFSFTDGFGQHGAEIMGLHSPVADIGTNFEAYLESLTTERRKKYRRMVADFEKTPLTFKLSADAITDAEIKFVQDNLFAKWGNEAGYAFRQTLWAKAVQEIRPNQILIMRVYDADALVFIQTMIIKAEKVICQSITKDEEKFYSGLAAMTDFECIKALCEKYKIFDASCRTGLTDPESIGVAKRATVNMNCIKPLLAIGQNFPDPEKAMIESRTVQGKEA